MWEALMDKMVAYQRQSVTTGAVGGIGSKTWATLLSNVRASIQSADSRTIETYARRQIDVTNVIYTNVDLDNSTAIPGGVKIGDRIQFNSVNYVIKGCDNDSNAAISPEPLFKLTCMRERI